ncbi:SDR family oxidoreductase [Zhihengliuella halotolerans]|uniref:NAD(P)-dependent dehydrogenase (Short-subunit alcohol dehydrogenase family) n=1 Tax=Zhihengliuella halotolerans TaxID=370736 RepID=A0A4Q8AEP0_9MICC|nr:SDR family oxidoreductase [Zhihengliuella halotolerans]RZU62760.1 NAD(P)-dependent dehydrogenase (short-subunit alcohol dehydrogenase family) [Zhihengliuella halotolerans]
MKQTAIITGGTGGMGLATARILGRDHRVVIADLNQRRLDEAVASLGEDGIEAHAVYCDITSRQSVADLFREAGSAGTLRAVVHAAGVSPQMGDAETMVSVNALGTIHVTEAALAVAVEGFALVNVASSAAHMAPRPLVPRRSYRLAFKDPARLASRLVARAGLAPHRLRSGLAYSLSKNFVMWYSQEMAGRFGARGARILSVSPGSFDTGMGRLENKSGSHKLLEYAALHRYGKPEEIGEVLAFCASDRPGYLTGIDILCDGGTKAGMDLKGMLSMTKGS